MTNYPQNGEANTKNEEKDKIWFQILALLSACLVSANAGMLFSWTSPSIPKIINDKVNYDIDLDQASYFTVIPPLGMISACLANMVFADSLGRKWTLFSAVLWYALAWILIATCTSVSWLYVARFSSGVGDSITFSILAIYVGEVCSPKVRTTYGNIYTLSIYVGQFSINLIGNFLSVQTTGWIGLGVIVVFAITFFFMPETPYFYLMKGRIEDARRSLRTLRRRENVEEELSRLKMDVDRQMQTKGHWKELFSVAVNRRAVLIALFLRFSQQSSGIGCFMVYTQTIFIKAGTDIAPATATLTIMALVVVLNACAGFTLDLFGRKKSYFFSVLFSGVVLVLLSVYFYIDEFQSEIDVSNFGWCPLTGMVLYIVFYSFGVGIVPTQMMGELFSSSIKAKALALLTIVFGTTLSVITKVFQLMITYLGMFSPFLFFAVCCFVSSCFSLFIVPETKGKTLEQIQLTLMAKVNKTKSPRKGLKV